MKPSGAVLAALLWLIAWPHAQPPAGDRQVVRTHFTTRDQQTSRYVYVPFEVPAGTTRLAIAYTYDRADGANVVDLGLFEPGPLTLGTRAFRGWSGGARDSIVVGITEASPGYWPGPMPAGTWHLALGLYKVGLSGVDVEVTIERSAGDTPAAPAHRAPRAAEPIARGDAWYSGVLHVHTTNSDGALTPQQIADKARAEKLDFVALTDHNTTAHQTSPIDAPGLLVIPGEEVTTPGGHFNVWGLEGDRAYIDFRIMPGDPAIAETIRAAHDRGALVAVNHPVSDCLACSWTHAYPAGIDAIEIANGLPAARQQAVAIWDVLLREGRRITAVGESDWHRGVLPLSVPSVRVQASELSRRAILDGIAAGRVVVMADGSTHPPELTLRSGSGSVARIGDTLRVGAGDPLVLSVGLPVPAYAGARVSLVWNGEPLATAVVANDGAVTFERFANVSGYFRIHVFKADGTPIAVTNPIFVKVAAR